MKINNIKSTDYRITDSELKVVFKDTTLEELQNIGYNLEVTTDSDELVETLTGWQPVKINYDIASESYEVEFRMVFKDKIIHNLESQLETANEEIGELKKENKTLEDAILEIAELVGGEKNESNV